MNNSSLLYKIFEYSFKINDFELIFITFAKNKELAIERASNFLKKEIDLEYPLFKIESKFIDFNNKQEIILRQNDKGNIKYGISL